MSFEVLRQSDFPAQLFNHESLIGADDTVRDDNIVSKTDKCFTLFSCEFVQEQELTVRSHEG